MTTLMIVTLDCRDSTWVAEYRRKVPPMIDRAGGRYLLQPCRPVMLEGEHPPPQFLAVIEFPSTKAAERFFNSPEYRPYAQLRRQGASSTIFLAEDATRSDDA